jgi:hypothetical protein
MNQIDHMDTFALLIGSSSFPEDSSIASIPNVLANLQYFKKSLINPEIVGIPESNITISQDENRSEIERKLRDIADKTRNKKYTLLIYYTGHGILSSDDFQLYLTTHFTSKQNLEIDGINIENFKKYIKKSIAGRKIVILDCCHSGAIIGAMGNISSNIQSQLNGFEGTYVMTSAAEDTPSLFPAGSPEQPTYFTGKLLEILNEGLDIDTQYCSLRDIYNELEIELKQTGLPRPQQSNFNSADQLLFSVNKKYILRRPVDEVAWDEAAKTNTIWGYMDFKREFPESIYVEEAKNKILGIEEDKVWKILSNDNSVSSLDKYMEKYPNGKYFYEADERIRKLRGIDEEIIFWENTKSSDEIKKFEVYLQFYPSGIHSVEAYNRLKELKGKDETKKQIELKEKLFWDEGIKIKNIFFFELYLKTYPKGKFVSNAKKEIQLLIEKKDSDNKERNIEINLWEKIKNINDAKMFENYLKLYPQGTYSVEANNYLKRIREETHIQKQEADLNTKEIFFWENIKDGNRIQQFEEYLKLYPSGTYSLEAKKHLEELLDVEKKVEEINIKSDCTESVYSTLKSNSLQNSWKKIKNAKSFKFFIGALGLVFLIFLVIKIRNSTVSTKLIPLNSRISDSTKKIVVTGVNILSSSVSLLEVKDGNISEDSLKYYKDFGELNNFKASDGTVFNYKGGVYNNMPNGYGIAHFKTAGIYRGTFKNGIAEGKGTAEYNNGDRFEGEFKNNSVLKGTYIWHSGNKFIGNWIDGEMNGYGEYYNAHGTEIVNCPGCSLYKGNFKNGEKIGYGKCYDKTGNLLYDGLFKDDKPAKDYPNLKK